MPNPRDFLPAKYKKNQTNSSIADDVDSDSPWSNLAKEPKVPEYRSVAELPRDSYSAKLADRVENSFSTDSASSASVSFKPKKKNNSKLASILIVFFLIIGVISSYLLTQQNQDNRQQASGECKPGDPYCGDDGWCKSGYTTGGGSDGCIPKVYTAYPTPTNGACPAGYQLSTGQCIPNGSLAVPIPDPITHNCGTGWEYNSSTDTCRLICPAGQIACPDNSCHATGVGAPDPCAPQGKVKCGGTVTEPGPGEECNANGQVCHEYRIEQIWCDVGCQTNCSWQYLSSSYQCSNSESCNPDNPTGTPPATGTPPPTVTTTAPGPVCSNIEMLNSTGTAMTADDDKSLKNGDQIKFRATATNVASVTVVYEFRIWAPNTTAWKDITNTTAEAAAANISAAYTIISSGHYVVQSHICTMEAGSDPTARKVKVCQTWEGVTGAPSTTN